MGNTIAFEGSGDDQTQQHSLHKSSSGGAPFTLQRKGSSFLEEPITHKLTERGETNVTLGEGGSSSNGRDGSEQCRGGRSDLMRYAVSEMQGWRSHMEDKHALNPTLATVRKQSQLLKDHHLFAVFDGHGGEYASQFCGEHLVDTLTSQKEWKKYLNLGGEQSVTGLQLLKSALTSSFFALDEKLMTAQRHRRLDQLGQLENLVYSMGGTAEHDVFQEGTRDHEKIINFNKHLPSSMPANVPLERSGSTGVVVLVTPHHIICANAGDSRAILAKKNGEVLPLSFDHKPTNDVEVTRVERDGGFVRAGRVDGDLAVSRSFGDFGYKNCAEKEIAESLVSKHSMSSSGRTSLSSMISKSSEPKNHRVTVHPDILVHTREPELDEFLVLACDGIWDRLTNKDCSDLVRTLVHDEGETDVGLICEEVIDTSLELDSRDNMTCLLAVFPAANMGTSSQSSRDSNHGNSAIIGQHPTTKGVMQRRHDRERSWGNNSTPAKRAQSRLEERRKKHREVLARANSMPVKTTASPTSKNTTQQNTTQRRRSVQVTAAASSNRKHKANTQSPPRAMSGRVRSSKSLRIQESGGGGGGARQ